MALPIIDMCSQHHNTSFLSYLDYALKETELTAENICNRWISQNGFIIMKSPEYGIKGQENLPVSGA
jgi:hypothetical protein